MPNVYPTNLSKQPNYGIIVANRPRLIVDNKDSGHQGRRLRWVPPLKDFTNIIYPALTHTDYNTLTYFVEKMCGGGAIPFYWSNPDWAHHARPWSPSTYFYAGDIVRPLTSFNGRSYIALNGGTSSTSEPTWTQWQNARVSDGAIIWKENSSIVCFTNDPPIRWTTMKNGYLRAEFDLTEQYVGVYEMANEGTIPPGGGGGGGSQDDEGNDMGSDIFFDDFESGTFSKWTSVSNSTSQLAISTAPDTGYGAKSLKYTGSSTGGYGYCFKNLGSNYTEWYSKIELYLSSIPAGRTNGMQTFWEVHTLTGGNCMQMSLHDADSDGVADCILVRYADNSGNWVVLGFDHNAVSLNTWHTLRVHWKKGGPIEYFTEGNLIFSIATPTNNNVTGGGQIYAGGGVFNDFAFKTVIYNDYVRFRNDPYFAGY